MHTGVANIYKTYIEGPVDHVQDISKGHKPQEPNGSWGQEGILHFSTIMAQ